MKRSGSFPEFTVEYNCQGVTIYIVISGYRFPDPGRLYGRPENCYPPEPSEWEAEMAFILIRDHDAEREKYGHSAKQRSDEIFRKIELPGEFLDELVEANIDEIWEVVDMAAGDYDDSLLQAYYDSISERDR